MDYCKEFAMMFDLYISRKWSEAKERLLQLKKQKYADPRLQYDKLIEIYLERCEVFLKTPPPADWDGVYHLTEK
jgi:adenylate cyclase